MDPFTGGKLFYTLFGLVIALLIARGINRLGTYQEFLCYSLLVLIIGFLPRIWAYKVSWLLNEHLTLMASDIHESYLESRRTEWCGHGTKRWVRLLQEMRTALIVPNTKWWHLIWQWPLKIKCFLGYVWRIRYWLGITYLKGVFVVQISCPYATRRRRVYTICLWIAALLIMFGRKSRES